MCGEAQVPGQGRNARSSRLLCHGGDGGDGPRGGSLALAQESWRSVPRSVPTGSPVLGPTQGPRCFLSSWSSCVTSLVQETSPVATGLLGGALGEAEQLPISGREQGLCPGVLSAGLQKGAGSAGCRAELGASPAVESL